MKLLQLQKRSMALAGTVMTAYLIFHMLTNLSFFSAEAFSGFYEVYNQPWLRWPLLIVVLASLFLHVKTATVLRIKNSRARGIAYKKHDKYHVPAPMVSLSIAFLLLFILVHIGQTVLADSNDIRGVMWQWFSSTWLLLFYLAGLFILAMHLQHSLVNVLQTLGISSKMYKRYIVGSVVLLNVGFAAVPVYIWVMS